MSSTDIRTSSTNQRSTTTEECPSSSDGSGSRASGSTGESDSTDISCGSESSSYESECAEGVVPLLELSKLYDGKKKSRGLHPHYSPVLTKSEYACHRPTPGFNVRPYDEEAVQAKMQEYNNTETQQLPADLEAVTVEMMANDDVIVENNEVLYEQNMDCEHLFFDSRNIRLDKQQFIKDVQQRQWYIEKYKQELEQLKMADDNYRRDTKALKRSCKILKREIKEIESDITAMDASNALTADEIEENIRRTEEEGRRLASENRVKQQCLESLERDIEEYESCSCSSASPITPDRLSPIHEVTSGSGLELEIQDRNEAEVYTQGRYSTVTGTTNVIPKIEQQNERRYTKINDSRNDQAFAQNSHSYKSDHTCRLLQREQIGEQKKKKADCSNELAQRRYITANATKLPKIEQIRNKKMDTTNSSVNITMLPKINKNGQTRDNCTYKRYDQGQSIVNSDDTFILPKIGKPENVRKPIVIETTVTFGQYDGMDDITRLPEIKAKRITKDNRKKTKKVIKSEDNVRLPKIETLNAKMGVFKEQANEQQKGSIRRNVLPPIGHESQMNERNILVGNRSTNNDIVLNKGNVEHGGKKKCSKNGRVKLPPLV